MRVIVRVYELPGKKKKKCICRFNSNTAWRGRPFAQDIFKKAVRPEGQGGSEGNLGVKAIERAGVQEQNSGVNKKCCNT